MVGPLISISFKKLTMGFIKCEQILFTICFMSKIFIVVDMLQSGQIKHTPQDCINEFIILKVESIGSCRVQFHLCTPAYIMSSEFTFERIHFSNNDSLMQSWRVRLICLGCKNNYSNG